MSARHSVSPRVVAPGGGKTLSVLGSTMSVKLTGEESGGAFSVAEERTPPNGGSPRHMHERESESFFVLEGDYEFEVGDALLRASPGAFLFAPPGIAHAFRNAGPSPARMLVVLSPGGLERFFEQVDSRAAAGTLSASSLVDLARDYGLHVFPSQREQP